LIWEFVSFKSFRFIQLKKNQDIDEDEIEMLLPLPATAITQKISGCSLSEIIANGRRFRCDLPPINSSFDDKHRYIGPHAHLLQKGNEKQKKPVSIFQILEARGISNAVVKATTKDLINSTIEEELLDVVTNVSPKMLESDDDVEICSCVMS